MNRVEGRGAWGRMDVGGQINKIATHRFFISESRPKVFGPGLVETEMTGL